MLQIQNISKEYRTGDLTQLALDNVSLNFRDNEFVAILGPSGSGKTTLLNIIGGLDRYSNGDLIINNISTRKYRDRDWDSYRNHTIGFIFQSYNLIPHQTILANVELALTISGISGSERKKRAKDALIKVGLGDHLHKRPNQMSGGQMQRVAIARALVNDPDILLADEPTGALDTNTSIQVMELLKEVAQDKLVIMVTHNPELAEQYATRIVKLKDGVITHDSAPYTPDVQPDAALPVHKNMGKASMSFGTALALSFNNLRTKKGRTFLTSFAGSIGIIGIALILSLSTGVNAYIETLQKDTMTSYPITVEEESVDLSSIMKAGFESGMASAEGTAHEKDAIYTDNSTLQELSDVNKSITKNNLTKFKQYLDDSSSPIHKYIGETGIVYSYNIKFGVYTHDPDGKFVNTDGSTLSTQASSASTNGATVSVNVPTRDAFSQLLPGDDNTLIGSAVTDNYEVVYGDWPKEYNDIVLVLNRNYEIDASSLYALGYLPTQEYQDIQKQIANKEKPDLEVKHWDYADFCKKDFTLLPASDTYVKNARGTYDYLGNQPDKLEKLLEKGVKLHISGVICPKEDATYTAISTPLGYTKALTDYLMNYANESEIVKAQLESKEVNVLTNAKFAPADDNAKLEETKNYIRSLSTSDKAQLLKTLVASSPMSQDSNSSDLFMQMSEADMAALLDQQIEDANSKDFLLMVYATQLSGGSYDTNLRDFGMASKDAPSSINIYADGFEAKEHISKCIEDYNKDVESADEIHYTDYVEMLMSSVTTIINVISGVLIAFVAVSLIVSSIMIGIITYISVLERTKEIGILRALGASKRNISQVFNAETFIIGLFSGLIGIGVTLLLHLPINAIIHAVSKQNNINAQLPVTSALILIALSILLTLIGGLIPSKKAAKKDPVTALRTE